MCYRGGRGIVPPVGVPPAGVRPDQMIVKFSWWPRDMATQMFLRHTDVAEPPWEVPSYTVTRKYLFYIFVFYGRLFVV